MAAGFGPLGLSPATFWSMTIHEFEAAVRGRMGAALSAGPPARADLDALLARYPDNAGAIIDELR